MPRIPRPNEGGEEGTNLSSGDPLAPSTPAPESAATSGDPVTEVSPPASTAPPGGDSQPTVASPPVEEPATAVHRTPDEPVAPQEPTADAGAVSAEPGELAPVDARPRFRQRTRMRRRLRYLRRLRELAFRDLGGLVFDLHRFGRDRNDLVTAKLEALANIDRELRTLQEGLQDRRDFTDLREAGIAACPRCGTLHDTDANFCPGCGTTLRSAIVRDAFPVTVTPADEATPAQAQGGATPPPGPDAKPVQSEQPQQSTTPS